MLTWAGNYSEKIEEVPTNLNFKALRHEELTMSLA